MQQNSITTTTGTAPRKVGAGLLSAEGTWYSCRHTEHCDTGDRLYKQLYPAEYEARHVHGYVDGLFHLCHDHKWVRISGDGNVTDDNWNPKFHDQLTQAQLDTLYDLLLSATAANYNSEYIENLKDSLGLNG